MSTRWAASRATAPRWRPPAVPTLVVVPHPDDEVLSSGGLIAGLRRRGIEVVVAAVTDGGAVYPGTDGTDLMRTRRHEQREALEYLGVPRNCIRRLGFADGRLVSDEAAIESAIENLVLEIGAQLVVAPWRHDHHTDHEACGRAAQAVCERLGLQSVGGLFWAYQHTDPDEIGADSLVALELSCDDLDAKQTALACHRSQTVGYAGLAPILSESELAPTTWDREYFFLSGTRGTLSTSTTMPSSSRRRTITS